MTRTSSEIFRDLRGLLADLEHALKAEGRATDDEVSPLLKRALQGPRELDYAGEKLPVGKPRDPQPEHYQTREILPTEVNHIIAAVTDPMMVKAFSGKEIEGVPDVQGQLRLIHDKVMPEFG